MGNNHKRTGDYAEQAIETGLAELGVDPHSGLGEVEIRKRRQQYGFNEIIEKTEPLWHRVFRHFWR